MAIVWKINGTALADLGAENVRLRRVNQAADELSWSVPASFDGAAALAIGDAVVLTRTVDAGSPVTWFRGVLRELPRAAEAEAEAIAYTARGGWELLERRAYLQSFKEASDPASSSSTLVDVLRGRVVLAQGEDGAKYSLTTAIEEIVEYAKNSDAPIGALFVDVPEMTVPWDEVTDMSCADVLSRLLQWVPDAVTWFDYSVDPPDFHCATRGALTAVDLEVQPEGSADDAEAYAPLESVSISPRHDLLCDRVALIYLATNRANSASWEVTTRDVYPPGTTGREDGALVRTIQLAGSVYSSTVLEQRLTTEEIPAALAFTGEVKSTDTGFSTIKGWFEKRCEQLRESNVTVKAFRDGRIVLQDGSAVSGDCARELLTGAITDWMQSAQGILTEQQVAKISVVVEIADKSDASKKERVEWNLSAAITATNATATLYTSLADDSFTPGEAVPTGLAEAVHSAVSVLQYGGRCALIEAEVTGLVSVGATLNLTGGLAAWEAMAALVQSVEYSLDVGRTQVVVGPAKHLGPDDLVELFRSNRNRFPVTSSGVRITAKSASGQRQGLSLYHPATRGGPLANTPPRTYTAALTMGSAVVPTAAIIKAGLETHYNALSGYKDPLSGDKVKLTIAGKVKFTATVTFSNISALTESDTSVFVVKFTVNSIDYYAQLKQDGLF